MKTFKKLGMTMSRAGDRGWCVRDKNGSTRYESFGQENKGQAMSACLAKLAEQDVVEFVRGEWRYVKADNQG